MATAGDVQTQLKQRELAQGERGLDIREQELEHLDKYRMGMLDLNRELGLLNANLKSRGLDLEALGLKSLDTYRNNELALRRDISKIDKALRTRGLNLEQMGLENLAKYRDSSIKLQTSELNSLDAYRKTTAGLEQRSQDLRREIAKDQLGVDQSRLKLQERGLDLESERNKIQAFSAASEDAYRSKLISAEERKQQLAEINGVYSNLEALARKTANERLADVYKLQADEAKLKMRIIEKEIEGGKPSEAAKKYAGLPYESQAQQRLRANDIDKLNISIEKAKDNENVAKSLIDSFYKKAPDANYIWYYHEGGIFSDNEAKRIDLPPGITAKDVVESAKKYGMSVQEALRKKGWIK